MAKVSNIFDDIKKDLTEEVFENVISNDNFKLERIISLGQVTPPGEWLDEEKNEWVLLLSGSAELLFEGSDEPVRLKSGDHLLIEAHSKHRVLKTGLDTQTVWLALHY